MKFESLKLVINNRKGYLFGLTMILLVFLFSAISCAQDKPLFQTKSVNKNENSIKKKVDEYLTSVSEQPKMASLSVAIVKNGEILFMKGYGWANVEAAYPATPKTRYQIASVTKPFTSMAVMLLVEERKISLDENAAKYLKWLPKKYQDITVRQLLTHTSGVNRDLRQDNLDTFSEEEFRRRLAAAPESSKGGEKFEYSNTGYILLGMIVEAVSGSPYEKFLNKRIFKPLGMKNTKYYESPIKDENRALGYQFEDEKLNSAPYFPGGFAAGGLVSSAEDLAKFVLAFESRKLLGESSVEQIYAPAKLVDNEKVDLEMGGMFKGEKTSYGFGWWLTVYRGHRLYTHGGGVSGFQAIINRYTDDKTAIIVLSNSKTAGVDRIASGIADIILLDKNPAGNISYTEKNRGVIKSGKYLRSDFVNKRSRSL